MAVVSISYLLESGVHFGHQTKRWNPKMKEFIFTSRDDIYIIDLQKTVKKIEEAYEVLKGLSENEGKILFVGTKKQAQDAVKEEALRTNMFYVNERWLGGTLTNFKTIRQRINRLEEIEKMEKDGKFDLLPKKEVIKIKKEYEKLVKYLSGIREMRKLPQALIIVDPTQEATALREAKKLNIPTFGIIDTNCDPDSVDYPIPANDDAIRAVKLVLAVLNNAVCESYKLPTIDFLTDEDKKQSNKEEVKAKEVKEEVKIEIKEEVKAEVKIEEIVEEVKEEVKEEPKKAVKKEIKKEEPKKVVKKETKEKEPKKVVKKETKEKEPKKTVKKETKEKEPKKTVKKETKK